MKLALTSDASAVAGQTPEPPSVDAGRRDEPRVFQAFWHDYRYWLPPVLMGLALTFIFLNPFIGDWDALDYTVFSVRGVPSSMALGRSLFTLFNHELYAIARGLFGVPLEKAYLIFKYTVVAESPLVIIVCWILGRDLTGSVRSATVAALLVAVSPMFVIYSGQVMTDVPSLLFTAGALVIHLRGVQQRRVWLVLAGAAVLGLGVNLRETVGLYLPWLIVAPFVGGWKFDRRTISIVGLSVLIFGVLAFGIFGLWFASDPAYRNDWQVWRSSSRDESARHPIGIANVRPFLIYFVLVAPLVIVSLPLAAWREWRAHRWSLLLTAAAVGFFANVTLFLNYSTTINWRYFLMGVPAMAPLAADYFVRSQSARLGGERRAFVMAVACVILMAVLMELFTRPNSREYLNRLAFAKDYNSSLQLLPRNAVIIAGSGTVAVTYWRGIGAGEWEWIGTGSGWPNGQLESKIRDHLKSGRSIFLDADLGWWQPCRWNVTEINELVGIDPRFHFRQVTPTIYEIRPIEDASAVDHPRLEKLLPANRAEEVKRCFNAE